MKLLSVRPILGWAAVVAVLLTGCKKDEKKPDDGPGTDTGRTQVSTYVEKDSRNVYYVSDLPGNARAGGGGLVLFSLKDHKEKDSALVLTKDWDISFTEIFNSTVSANNGEKIDPPGHQGLGKADLIILKQPFDEVKEAPSDEEFDASRSYTGLEEAGKTGWFRYDMNTHIMNPVANRTIVIRTVDGKYAKMEMFSFYKGNPANPTLQTPAPYLNFRYWVQENGSKDLSIPE